MTTTLTDRDKKLLYILLLVLIVAVSYRFLITPFIDNYKEASDKNKTLVQRQSDMENEIANIDTYKAGIENAKADYESTRAKVFGDFREPDMDQAITKLLLGAGVGPTTFTITDVSPIKILPYNASAADVNGAKGVISDPSSKITAANIQIVATGTADNVINAMKVFDSTSGIQIQSSEVNLAGDSSTFKATISMILSENY